ncbi:MAG: hypothetical protein GXP27_17425, partial [Planctomycetes bacterium]|nr:hypothetical protein [Planctomycetota bacterium]
WPSNTAELLRFGRGQWPAWTDFFIATLRAQAIQAGSEEDIVPIEGDGFLTY